MVVTLQWLHPHCRAWRSPIAPQKCVFAGARNDASENVHVRNRHWRNKLMAVIFGGRIHKLIVMSIQLNGRLLKKLILCLRLAALDAMACGWMVTADGFETECLFCRFSFFSFLFWLRDLIIYSDDYRRVFLNIHSDAWNHFGCNFLQWFIVETAESSNYFVLPGFVACWCAKNGIYRVAAEVKCEKRGGQSVWEERHALTWLLFYWLILIAENPFYEHFTDKIWDLLTLDIWQNGDWSLFTTFIELKLLEKTIGNF